MPKRRTRTAILGRPSGRPNGRVGTREHILRAAVDVFAKSGYAGARVERISSSARRTDRMIYYYFGSKEKLFIAVLERIYQELGDAEAALDLTGLSAQEGLRALVHFTWRHYRAHPELLILLNNENLHRGRHVARSKRVKQLSFPLLSILSGLLARGIRERVFRRGIHVHDLYIAMCSLGYFYLSNRYTLSAFLGRKLMTARALAHWEQIMQDMVLSYVRRPKSQIKPA